MHPVFMASFSYSTHGLWNVFKISQRWYSFSDNVRSLIKRILIWLNKKNVHMNMAECPVCLRHVLSHSNVVICVICKHTHHLKCISLNTEEQSYILEHQQSWYCMTCIMELFPFNLIENDKLFLAEINNYDLKNRIVEISDALFQPFEINSDDVYSPIHEIDPDINFYNEIDFHIGSTCNYYMEDAFSFIINKRYNPEQSGRIFSLCHLNIRSLQANLNDFENYLNSLEFEFAFIGISETWLHDGNCDLYNLSCYTLIEKHRHNKRGGGVGIYIR